MYLHRMMHIPTVYTPIIITWLDPLPSEFTLPLLRVGSITEILFIPVSGVACTATIIHICLKDIGNVKYLFSVYNPHCLYANSNPVSPNIINIGYPSPINHKLTIFVVVCS